MARGGRRSGKTGQSYPNRSDLNGAKIPLPTTAPSAQYGEGAKLQAAQAAVPMGPSPAANIPQGPMPGAAGPLMRPSDRPREPVTAGIDSGPGAGATPTAPLRPGDDVLPQLQAMYAAFPSEGLRQIIEDIESGAGG